MDATQAEKRQSESFDSAQQRIHDIYTKPLTKGLHVEFEHPNQHDHPQQYDHAIANAENEGMPAHGREQFESTVGEIATHLAQKVDDQVPVDVDERSAK
ncbi:unnamed protein product [Bursaphelenchus xylophilus]|uniref:(pine wood nematode) hypothetical protein n=1 Tax=Bursaphelenchus xylophilus TaxID=6326 RepID=A0A1I7RJ57_BURXY|nr:unnamed protein product [Bursaphelenchus xylophilus]CAG9119376.1 unnamed protein product [Bursaphelenchus xylophilus]